MKNVRVLNGYRVLYLPNHPKCMKNSNWDGYVYEHIVVVEEALGRLLTKSEVTHHLDGNRANNRLENLLVLDRGQHAKLHAWFDRGAPGVETLRKNGVNSEKAKEIEPAYCLCGKTLQQKQKRCCSSECAKAGARKVERPSKETLEKEIQETSMRALGRKYQVSDNAVRKWAKQYGIISKLTLSQAEGTPSEGAETSGGVQSP